MTKIGSCRARLSAAYVNSALGSGSLLDFTSLVSGVRRDDCELGSIHEVFVIFTTPVGQRRRHEGGTGEVFALLQTRLCSSPLSSVSVTSFLVRAVVLTRNARAHPPTRYMRTSRTPKLLHSVSERSGAPRVRLRNGASRSRPRHDKVSVGYQGESGRDWATGILQRWEA